MKVISTVNNNYKFYKSITIEQTKTEYQKAESNDTCST